MSDERVSLAGLVTAAPEPPAVTFTPKEQSERPGINLLVKAVFLSCIVAYCVGVPYLMYKLMQWIIHLI